MRRLIFSSIRAWLLFFAWEITAYCADLSPVVALNAQPPFILTQPKNVTNVVEGDTATFTVVAGGSEPLEYQWLKDSQPVAGATASTLTLTDLTSGSASYGAIVRNAFGSITSNPALLLVWRKLPPIITGAPISQQVAEGQPVGLYVFVASPPPVTYQWSKNGQPISEATEPDFTLSNAASADSGDYTVTVTNPYGSVTSAPATLSVGAPPTDGPPRLSGPSIDFTYSVGGNFYIANLIEAGGAVTLQWLKDSKPVPGANLSELFLTNIQFSDAGNYQLFASNSFGTTLGPVSRLIVVEPFFIVTQPQGGDWVEGQPASLSVTVTGGGPEFFFQWYRNDKGITGATSPELHIPSVSAADAGTYVVRIQSAGRAVDSTPAVVTVNGKGPPPDGPPPQLQAGPSGDLSVFEGGAAYFSIEVVSSSGEVSFQWLKDSQPIPGANLKYLYLTDIRPSDAGYYQVRVTDRNGSSLGPTRRLVLLDGTPTITVQPRAEEWAEGQAATLSVTASGPFLSFQWFKDGEPIPGAVYPDLHFSPLSREDDGIYTVVVHNDVGSVTSAPVLLIARLIPLAPTFFSNLYGQQTLGRGESFTFTVVAGGSLPLHYQWYKDGVAIPGAQSATYSAANVDVADSGKYQVEVSNSVRAIRSDPAKIFVVGAPEILVQPVGRTDLPISDLPYILLVKAKGAPSLQFSWYRDGQLIRESVGNWDGATTVQDNYYISTWGDSGEYQVIVADAFDKVASASAKVVVKTPEPGRQASGQAPDLKRDLVAYWPLDEVVNGLLEDKAGTHHLTWSGFIRPGRNSAGLELPIYAADDLLPTYFSKGPEDDLPINRHAAFTVSFWMQFQPRTGSCGFPYFFQEGDTDNADTLFGIFPTDGERFRTIGFHFRQAPQENVEAKATELPMFGGWPDKPSWRHFAFAQEEDGHRWFYIDGVEDGVVLPAKPAGAWKLNFTRLGAALPFVSPNHSGTVSALFGPVPCSYLLDDVAVWKRALTVEEIRALRTGGIPGFHPKPLAIQSLSLDNKSKTIAIHWNAIGDGLYSLLKSANLAGPWIIVTNRYPYSFTTGYTPTNSFTEAATAGMVFYQIRKTSE